MNGFLMVSTHYVAEDGWWQHITPPTKHPHSLTHLPYHPPPHLTHPHTKHWHLLTHLPYTFPYSPTYKTPSLNHPPAIPRHSLTHLPNNGTHPPTVLFFMCLEKKKDTNRRKGKGRRFCLEGKFIQILAALFCLVRFLRTGCIYPFLSNHPFAILPII